ncbi:hypothetical protein DUNSADRAFT_13075 [Dunaliella salina]|uniref:Encoded protein n=1 Tax=Dunaliella salina TaxID=3046 RepID=A0ABQ7H3H2_DUNSA|nr:hypothetical protein DUNSADRAFT_13075 [Dunaliella salina]|eukprot:KAF5841412.1 hypothetical protein DUNSADRAFT_13075 [Dunaliella salina]
MEPLRGLQRALTKSAAQLSASAIAAEATMLLQPPQQQPRQQQQQQDDQHPLQEAWAQQGDAPSSPLPPPTASPFGQQQQHGQQQNEDQGAGAHSASAPIPSLPPVTDPRAAAAFGSRSRSEVVAVALRIANTLLGRAHAAAADPPPAFVLELVHRPPGQVAGPPPPRPQPQAPSAARARRLSGGLSNQGWRGHQAHSARPRRCTRPSCGCRTRRYQRGSAVRVQPTGSIGNNSGGTRRPRGNGGCSSSAGDGATAAAAAAHHATGQPVPHDSSPNRRESLTTPFTEFWLPSHTEDDATWAAHQQQQQQHRHQHRRHQHRRNVSASDVGCLPGLGATVAAAAPSFASNLLFGPRSTEGNSSNPLGLRRTSAGANATTATAAPFSRHSESLMPALRSPRASGMPPTSPPPGGIAPQQPPTFMAGHSRSQHRRTPPYAPNSPPPPPPPRPPPPPPVPPSPPPPHHRHTRTVSATESQIEATTAVISGALAGDEGLTGPSSLALTTGWARTKRCCGTEKGSMALLRRRAPGIDVALTRCQATHGMIGRSSGEGPGSSLAVQVPGSRRGEQVCRVYTGLGPH